MTSAIVIHTGGPILPATSVRINSGAKIFRASLSSCSASADPFPATAEFLSLQNGNGRCLMPAPFPKRQCP
jgi:hypothetical protein